jgi:hypothetical protein
MGQPPWLWRRRCVGQSLIGDFSGHILSGAGNQLVCRVPAMTGENSANEEIVRKWYVAWENKDLGALRVTYSQRRP